MVIWLTGADPALEKVKSFVRESWSPGREVLPCYGWAVLQFQGTKTSEQQLKSSESN